MSAVTINIWHVFIAKNISEKAFEESEKGKEGERNKMLFQHFSDEIKKNTEVYIEVLFPEMMFDLVYLPQWLKNIVNSLIEPYKRNETLEFKFC